jgi:hypothetical protein
MMEDLRLYPFVEDALPRFRSEYEKITGDTDLSRLWENVRVIDGTTEYIAMDLVEFLAFQHLKMQGRTYDDPPDEDYPHGLRHREIVYSAREGSTTSYQVPSMNFHQHVPRIMTNFDSAVQTLNIRHALSDTQSFSLTMNLNGRMWDLWIADVNGHKAAGNLPAEAVTHAWGIGVGLWSADPLTA